MILELCPIEVIKMSVISRKRSSTYDIGRCGAMDCSWYRWPAGKYACLRYCAKPANAAKHNKRVKNNCLISCYFNLLYYFPGNDKCNFIE